MNCDNKFGECCNCPAKMSDGRLHTNYMLNSKLVSYIKEVNGLNTFTGELELDNKSIKELCFSLSNEIDNLFMIVLSSSDEKVFISCFISKNLIAERNFNASNIIKQLAPIIDGSGGGQPFFATGGGKNINAIDKALAESKKIISQL